MEAGLSKHCEDVSAVFERYDGAVSGQQIIREASVAKAVKHVAGVAV
jgi:hypothetical protein